MRTDMVRCVSCFARFLDRSFDLYGNDIKWFIAIIIEATAVSFVSEVVIMVITCIHYESHD